ncbi:MAG: ACT domain-containing protein, partial [Pseudomonadota bacterium]
DINMDFELTPNMIFVRHQDRKGFIGEFGMAAAKHDINIATLNLGRTEQGGDAILVAALDAQVSDEARAAVQALGEVKRVKRLQFDGLTG